jgi:hypothetical protein
LLEPVIITDLPLHDAAIFRFVVVLLILVWVRTFGDKPCA